ncbi:MAG TPA: SRPBCC family protein [Thermomicrobiales bacterium]|nr:SRPBCC family protein [Thermomicrobiales bacterium]
MEVSHSVTIGRPADEVFGLVGDPDGDTTWGSLIVESEQLSPGPVGVGATYRQTATLLGARLTVVVEVTAYEPGRLLRYRISEPIAVEHCRTLEATPDGTRLTFFMAIDPRGHFQTATGLLRHAARRQMEADMDAIKAMLEASPGQRG